MTLKARAKKKPGCRSRLATVNGWEYCTMVDKSLSFLFID